MTRRCTTFDDWAISTIGTNEAGHTVRGGGAPGYAPVYGDAAVVPRGERYLAFINDATSDYHAVSNNAIDADANRATFSIVTAFAKDLCTVEELHIYARGAGTATMTDFVRARIVLASGVIAIDKMVASAYTAGSGASAGTVTLTAGHAYIVRFDGNGGAVNLKIWDATLGTRAEFGFAGEPAAYNLSPTGLTPTAAGWVALGGRHSTITGRIAMFNYLATGTNGDAAVCPNTDSEFEAWMADDKMRRAVTMVLQATGYDSSGAPYTKKVRAQISNTGYNAHEQDGLTNPHFQAIISQVPTFSVELPGGFSGGGSVSVGELGVRNPARIVAGAAYLLLDGASGCYASTPDSAALDITGDIQIDAKVAADDWTPAAVSVIVAKWQALGNLAYRLYINTTGTLIFAWSADGTAILAAASTVATGFADGSAHWVRVTMDVNDGAGNRVIKFYTSDDGLVWVQLGSTVTTAGITSIFSGTSKVEIGADVNGTAERLAGRVTRAQIYNGIAGTLAVDFNLANVVKGTTSFSGPTGEVWTINGAAVIRETPQTRKGIRDDWLRYAWDRDPCVMRLGDPAKPYHDHRVILRGRLGMPTAPSPGRISFKLADMSDILNQDINPELFSGGTPYDGQRKPELFGKVAMCEPPLTDSANLIFTISRRPIKASAIGGPVGLAYDNGILISSASLVVTGINTGTDEITLVAAHGMAVGWVFVFHDIVGGTIPAVTGAAINFEIAYYVVGVPAGDRVKISRTLGGTAIDFTSAGSGAFAGQGHGWRVDTTAATLTLVGSPAGRITYEATSGVSKPGSVYAEMGFGALALSLNHKDQVSFDALDTIYTSMTVGYWVDTQKVTCAEVFSRFAAGTGTWFCPVPDGRLQVGAIGLPGTAITTLTEAEILKDSMKVVDVIRPVDMSTAQITCTPFFLTQGFLVMPALADPAIKQNKGFVTPYSYGATSTPLEDFPPLLDANRSTKFDTYFGTGLIFRNNMATLYKWKLGIFQCQARLRAITFKLGSTIRAQHGRLGWEVYGASNPASPDNTATLDSELAVVVGKSFDLKKPHPVTLKLMRPIHANFPIADIT